MFGLPRRPTALVYTLLASAFVLLMLHVVYHQRDGNQVAHSSFATKVTSWWKASPRVPVPRAKWPEPEGEGGASIYFAETSGKSRLSLREACAVESASRHHPHRNVTLFSVGSLTSDDEALQPLLALANVRVATLNLSELFSNTPLEQWHRAGSIVESSFPVEHLSDAARLAVLWKLGGVYLDTDVLCVRPFGTSLHNALGLQQKEEANGAVLLFDAEHRFLHACMLGYVTNFSRTEWATQGPDLVTRVLRATCRVEYLADVIRDPETCGGVTLLPEAAFYPIPWNEWQRLLGDEPIPTDSYTVHLWGKMSRDTATRPGSGDLLDTLTRDNCPSVYKVMLSRDVV